MMKILWLIQWYKLKDIIMHHKQRDFENDEARSGCQKSKNNEKYIEY